MLMPGLLVHKSHANGLGDEFKSFDALLQQLCRLFYLSHWLPVPPLYQNRGGVGPTSLALRGPCFLSPLTLSLALPTGGDM
jgi:hypothetical protein